MNVSFSATGSAKGIQSQQGIGLIEVMIALLLLALAVLGFTAMQMTAVKATDESLMRTRALTIMRGGAEMMRANPAGIPAFKAAIDATGTSANSTVGGINENSCLHATANCSVYNLATRDAITVTNLAKQADMRIGMTPCPGTVGLGTLERQCMIASWGTTQPTFTDTVNDNACATTTLTYKPGAQCFILEAY